MARLNFNRLGLLRHIPGWVVSFTCLVHLFGSLSSHLFVIITRRSFDLDSPCHATDTSQPPPPPPDCPLSTCMVRRAASQAIAS